MKKKNPHKRKPGEFEIRILSDGRVVMVAPDETLLEIAQVLDPNSGLSRPPEQDEELVIRKQTNADQRS